MPLDDIVAAIERAMQGKAVSPKLLRKKDVSRIIDYYYSKTSVSPGVLEALAFPRLIADYLRISPSAQEAIGRFHQRHPEYFTGKITNSFIRGIRLPTKTETILARVIVRQSMLTHRLIDMFDFYLKHRLPGQNFNSSYIRKNPGIRKKYG